MKTPIDVVITWVDPSDEEWQKERAKYRNLKEEANGEVRYRDWGFLKYWFRGLEKNAPWVNRVFFVTCGHYPDWLNTENGKLQIVRHKDYIPEEYLPTFNSNVIELFFHKIPGLSEQFVYFNDDMFLLGPMEETEFFADGKPADTLAWNAVSAKAENSMIEHIVLNDMEILEKHFDKKTVQKQQRAKLLSPKNGAGMVKTTMLWSWKHFTGIENPHVAQPYLKSVLETVWEKEGPALRETAQNRFRTAGDLSLWLARYWNLVSGNYVLKSRKGDLYYVISDDNRSLTENVLAGKVKTACFNDSDGVKDFEKAKKELTDMFEKLYPEKSGFEK
ncbi:MAG: Stealth CR1 domain-containing protein [Erysipelotrichales bacterium]|nr:Stealth CR1 domain-containing protein [Erysipelotrichales bacterium]